MTEIELANAALDSIKLDPGEYDTWLKVALGYKAAAGDEGTEHFNAWNIQQPNNRGARDLKDYIQMDTTGGITVGTLLQIAEQRGGFTIPKNADTAPQRYTKTVTPSVKTQPEPPRREWNRYHDGSPLFYSTILKDAPESRREQRRAYVNSVFKKGDTIALAKCRCHGGEFFTLDELDHWAQTANEENSNSGAPISLQGLHDTEEEKGGVFICINPTDGKGRNDSNVTDYRTTLIETDTATDIPTQIDTLKRSGIPILALTKTGGKSVHAVVYVGAGTDRAEYNNRVEYLHKYLKEHCGFLPDPADKNPARLTRMAGFLRWDKNGNRKNGQQLIATGTANGADPWEEFYNRAESLKEADPPRVLAELSLDEINSIKDPTTPEETAEIDRIKKRLEEKKKQAEAAAPNSKKLAEAMEYYRNTPPLKTGLAALDALLNEGILGDLYVLGGTSGMGKTTLALQLATALAREGVHVFFYSYEQDRNSLTAKIMSQLGAEIALATYGRAGLYNPTDLTAEDLKEENGERVIVDAATRTRKTPPTREILINGGKYFNAEERETYKRAEQILDGIKTLHLIEADRTYTAQRIAEDTADWGRIYGYNHVALFIDYLQKIPAEAGMTDKQALDVTTATLHEISRSHRVPILALSSLNRESYKGESPRAAEVALTSFKESGGIEYDTDVALGLQADGDTLEERKNRLAMLHGTGSIYLRTTLLKSRRGGKLGEHATLEFFPEYDFFVTADNEKPPTTEAEF